MNYKCFKGKYIIYESNGFGKEYEGTNDKLLYEGEYLSGERSGKGKEYYVMAISNLKVNIYMEKEMEKAKNKKNILVNYYLKVNI